MRAQRLRDGNSWPYHSAIRVTDIEEAFPIVHTPSATSFGGIVTLRGD